MTIHQQITSYAQEVSIQIKKKMENDLTSLIKEGYFIENLILCFYRDEPLHYSVRIENKIIIDRWLIIEFKCENHFEEEQKLMPAQKC